MKVRVLCLAALGFLAGCASNHRAAAPATESQRAATLDRVKQLAGTWEMVDDKGHAQTASVFQVTSDGSVVREIMFPGSPKEMTNMYHMDGPAMVMTHYCAMGNQPRLRSADTSADRIDLTLDRVSNMTSPDQMYMGGLSIEFKDADTIVERWTSYQRGKVEEQAVFELKRKRA